MPKRKKLAPWIFGSGPEPVCTELTVDQKHRIAATVGVELSAEDWKNIEQARHDYILGRWNKRQAVEYKQLQKRIKGLIRDSNALLGSIKLDKLGVIIWAQLAHSESLSFGHLDLYRMVFELERRARGVDEGSRHLFESGEGATAVSPWDQLVATLATVFRGHDLPTTSARSSRARDPEPSLFVSFVRAIIDTFPSDVSEHARSWRATAEATAKSLAKMKHAQGQPLSRAA